MDADLTARELAGLLGVSKDTIYNWEVRGRRPMRTPIRERVGNFIDTLNCNVKMKINC